MTVLVVLTGLYLAGLILALGVALGCAMDESRLDTPRPVLTRLGRRVLAALFWPITGVIYLVRVTRRDEWIRFLDFGGGGVKQ